MLACAATTANAYVLNGKSWASGPIVMQLGLGSAGRTLTDGNTNWNAAVAPALDAWNQQVARVQFTGVMNSGAPLSSGDRVNTVGFSNTVFGQAFGSGTLAVTYYIMQGSNMVEADVLFNSAQTFDSYRGPLHFGSSGYATADIRRVLLHELGHALGLNHANGDVIMNALTSDREVLATDDIAGAQAMYGVSTVVIQPDQTPSSSLVSISTRMRVGLNDDVLIGGFTLKGTQPKTLLLRGIGPTLAQFGVAGALQDPVLELHDASGAIIAQNDNWQAGGQAAQILATGKAPPNAAEAALLVTLNPGSYTAIIRGANNTQGVALVEGYEMDAPATRMTGLSTRGRIGVGDEVMIGGFAVQGSASKRVIIRGLGPSLASLVKGVVADPILEVHDGSGNLIAVNDNWVNSPQVSDISISGQAPTSALDSAVIATLAPGNYTAVVRGANGATGVGLVDVYDLEP
ncbi:MAG: M10 family metallopeptidase domain-containing protein [Verrucomicrobiota bacterium]|nr:M10 family metallopeptidase domain-containing protein [Verrucomicrobiota bacterium]